jgi:hypothetical protein
MSSQEELDWLYRMSELEDSWDLPHIMACSPEIYQQILAHQKIDIMDDSDEN